MKKIPATPSAVKLKGFFQSLTAITFLCALAGCHGAADEKQDAITTPEAAVVEQADADAVVETATAATEASATISKAAAHSDTTTEELVDGGDPRIKMDKYLAKRFSLDSITMNDAGGLKAEAVFKTEALPWYLDLWCWANKERRYRVAYIFTWVDERGQAVESVESVWIEIFCEPGGDAAISAAAPDKSCADFALEMRGLD